MSRVSAGEIKELLVPHKDRLCRFGFDYFKHMAMGKNLTPAQLFELLDG